ncbi:hypothetical protein PLESTB_000342200 [Pleodorina starrii]|uniref:Prostaglandin E synthase 2 n=1 Tax=Pleodorina starrii TaxID=330485 RepID=A0A9W6EZG6_9CHLO|nr:hypothetical protein PLESTM_000052400 [Pleodorina starrii]GLC50101.1 hypothetical protein PLESTB_000342200 [Pleodorina starrii]GLC73119.1 hypothetical protein PLESTF_001334200 [Pleodorina starrii]
MSSAGALRRLPTLLFAQSGHANVISHVAASSRLINTWGADQRYGDSKGQRAGILAAATAALGIGAAAAVTTSAADAPTKIEVVADPYARPVEARPLPSNITLYQYEVCPYCCKVRAFLDYYKLPYTVIEVNPLTKGELKWSTYKKVPVVQLDEEIVADSSAIMSRLATDIAAARPAPPPPAAAAAAPASTSQPPAPAAKRSSSWSFWGSRGGDATAAPDVSGATDQAPAAAAAAAAAPAAAPGAPSTEALSEEIRWRKWVDEKLVKVLTANIYRNWDESVETFKYITEQTGWSWGAREVARWAGAVMMWQVGKRMPAKYGIEGDLRVALYDAANDFADNALRGRRFAGGDAPNLADLSAFGVLRAVRRTGAFRDLMAHSRLGPWFEAMDGEVGGSARINAGPGDSA